MHASEGEIFFQRSAPMPRIRPGVVIAVGNQKGGVGKTSNTVHLATALAEQGRKCLVWDLDVNCGSTQHFGIPDNMAILGTYEVLMGAEQPDEVIVREGDLEEVELPANVHLLP